MGSNAVLGSHVWAHLITCIFSGNLMSKSQTWKSRVERLHALATGLLNLKVSIPPNSAAYDISKRGTNR